MAVLDDSPRAGRELVITDDARTFVIDLGCISGRGGPTPARAVRCRERPDGLRGFFTVSGERDYATDG